MVFLRPAFFIRDMSTFTKDRLCWLTFRTCWVKSSGASMCAIFQEVCNFESTFNRLWLWQAFGCSWKENKSVICSLFLFSTKACIQAWSLTLFTRLRLCQKLKSFSWGQVMISKDSESVCQSYPLHLLWESPLTCFLFSYKDMETPPHRCLTGQGWSLTALEYIKIRVLRDTSTISHMQAILHLYDSSDCGIYI